MQNGLTSLALYTFRLYFGIPFWDTTLYILGYHLGYQPLYFGIPFGIPFGTLWDTIWDTIWATVVVRTSGCLWDALRNGTPVT